MQPVAIDRSGQVLCVVRRESFVDRANDDTDRSRGDRAEPVRDGPNSSVVGDHPNGTSGFGFDENCEDDLEVAVDFGLVEDPFRLASRVPDRFVGRNESVRGSADSIVVVESSRLVRAGSVTTSSSTAGSTAGF
ncbi:hypothetical protein C447_14856 [Halococcus hamelinensis 100A6]|uniref:Uncharacterized protein n=1 Tax=Halococcus hamelinensis 100A6 TaxID=1132509 RepID=M0LSN3_9EURY|nr:hypothetical protein C447_14856 [Halococcus hamelinensis 100A6]